MSSYYTPKKCRVLRPNYPPILRAHGWEVWHLPDGPSPFWERMKLVKEGHNPRKRGEYRVARVSWGIIGQRFPRTYETAWLLKNCPELMAELEQTCRHLWPLDDARRRLGDAAIDAGTTAELATFAHRRELHHEEALVQNELFADHVEALAENARRDAAARAGAKLSDEELERAIDALM